LGSGRINLAIDDGEDVIDKQNRGGNASQDFGLTRREREVLQLVCDGMTDQEIAVALGLRTPTINKHLRAILMKIGAKSRTEAAVRAFKVGLIV
jgi:DNA-binding CsgD family transcriptional regulator